MGLVGIGQRLLSLSNLDSVGFWTLVFDFWGVRCWIHHLGKYLWFAVLYICISNCKSSALAKSYFISANSDLGDQSLCWTDVNLY
jgi:hypothetical protein